MRNALRSSVFCLAGLSITGGAQGQPQAAPPATAEGEPSHDAGGGDDAVSKANNPLTSAIGVNFQNYYVPSLYGVPDAEANSFLFRGVIPFKLGIAQIGRLTLPVNTVPAVDADGDPDSGLGDLNLFDVLLLSEQGAPVQFGIGPQATFPTHTDDALGADAWQLGAAAVVILQPSKELLAGLLVTWQTDIAGDDDTNQLLTQPLVILQVGAGFYLRSTGIPTFDLESGDYSVPFGVGAGKVVKIDDVVLNMFLEPQFTLLHHGRGQPALQLFSGINLQVF